MRGGPSKEKCEINFCDVERPKGKAKLRQGRPNTLFYSVCDLWPRFSDFSPYAYFATRFNAIQNYD